MGTARGGTPRRRVSTGAAVTIRLPALHAGQAAVVAAARRYNVLACGRRWGKTTLGIDRLVAAGLTTPVAWMSPTYRMLTEVWRAVRGVLAPLTVAVSEQQHRLELATGGVVDMWSLERADVVRGRRYARVVIDEAAMVRNLGAVWQEVVRPTLTDLCGDAWLLSTPRGHNFFWHCFVRGQAAQQGTSDSAASEREREREWMSWQLPTASNPHMPPAEVAAMQRELPEKVFAQEVLAQFVEDSGGVFRRVYEAATAVAQEHAQAGHAYVVGCDWARSGDYSCFAVVDVTSGELVLLDRFTDTAFATQLLRLHALCKRFAPQVVVAEENSMGLPLVEQLGREGLPLVAFRTTNASKQAIIDALALAFEQGALRVLDNAVLLGELLAFEATRLPSGLLRYGAPAGQHDDCVMSLALAWHGAAQAGPLVLW